MNKAIPHSLTVLFTILLFSAGALAGDTLHQHHVIKIKAGADEAFEADLLELAVGESETFVTESGKTIDLIRTTEGVEVYIDGELLDLGGPSPDGVHKVIHRRVSVECQSDTDNEDCDHLVWLGADGDQAHEFSFATDDHHRVIFIEKYEESINED